MTDHEISLAAGDMCLFWGGLPHQMETAPTMPSMPERTFRWCIFSVCTCLPTCPPADDGRDPGRAATDASEHHNFERWNGYARSGDPAKAGHAVNELLLRLERMRFEPYLLVPTSRSADGANPFDQQSSRNVGRMCDFIAENFLVRYRLCRHCCGCGHPSEIRDERIQEVDRHDAQRICQSPATELRPGDADELGLQRIARGDGERLRLAQRLQQVVPQARRHVALRFSEEFGKRPGLNFVRPYVLAATAGANPQWLRADQSSPGMARALVKQGDR